MVRNYRAMLLPLVALLMMTLGGIAAIGPVRQGLRIQPIEALRDEQCGTTWPTVGGNQIP
jgi:hypothetical protein